MHRYLEQWRALQEPVQLCQLSPSLAGGFSSKQCWLLPGAPLTYVAAQAQLAWLAAEAQQVQTGPPNFGQAETP